MEIHMKEIGKMIKKKDEAYLLGKVVINMKVNLKMVIEKERELIFIQMVINMKVIGLKMKRKVKVYILGKMEIDMKVIGKMA